MESTVTEKNITQTAGNTCLGIRISNWNIKFYFFSISNERDYHQYSTNVTLIKMT